MSEKLQGKRVVVVGGTSGIGMFLKWFQDRLRAFIDANILRIRRRQASSG
jgi:hypothetical protein